jgi:hypothetical protein
MIPGWGSRPVSLQVALAFWGDLPCEASPSIPLHAVEREGPAIEEEEEVRRIVFVGNGLLDSLFVATLC